MKVYIKKKRINEEDDTTQNVDQQKDNNEKETQQNNTQQQSPAVAELNSLQMQYDAALRTFNETKLRLLAQLRNINTKYNTALSLSMSESAMSNGLLLIDDRYKKKLFENRSRGSEVEELTYLFKISIDRLGDTITKTASIKDLITYARNVKTFLTKSEWNKEIMPKNHWDELSDFIRNKFKNGNNLKLRDSELDKVMENLKELFKKSATFSWIFGKDEE